MRIPTNFHSRTYYSDNRNYSAILANLPKGSENGRVVTIDYSNGNENTKSIFDGLVIRKTYPPCY